MTAFPLAAVHGPFRALAAAFVPELAGAGAETWEGMEAAIAAALARRPPAMARQLVLFVRLLDLWALATRGRRLERLAPEQRAALLRRLERAPLLLVRRGVWGLRTLVFLGYYTRPDVIEALGYRARAAGWEAVR